MIFDKEITTKEIIRVTALALVFIAATNISKVFLDSVVTKLSIPPLATYFIILFGGTWLFKIA